MTASTAFAPLRLFTSKVCPFAQRATIAAHELGFVDSIAEAKYSNGAFEVVEIDLKNKPEYYTRDINPRGKVPALEITHAESGTKEVLVESALIADFLLQAADSPATLNGKARALDRFRANLVVDTFSNQVVGAFYNLLREKDAAKQPEATEKLLEGIRAVQAFLSADGPYALGAEFTIADILTAPFLARFVVNEHYRNFVVPDTPEYARFNRWRAALAARPSVVATTPDKEVFIDGYRGYALA
ncbi:hypothetical protein H9P43_003279 [Blastocladiella emersonii ATCC 22665]|nr:hypothetical protein H9P43_003279 [Blastocladiella emersonii ATCC 22665]